MLAYPGIENLGDVMQSRAARRFLPQVDCLIERERLSTRQHDGPVKLITNGWFMHDATQWPPHPSIDPLPVSMHFVECSKPRVRRWIKSARDVMLSGAGAEWLRAHGPIGARDMVTCETLLAHDIPAYHTGCLTLTLKLDRPVPRGDYLVACDLSPRELAALQRLARGRQVVSVTHLGGETLDQQGQEREVERLLDLYAGAAAVVTTRIHAAQPCLAIGTPVLLLHPRKAARRIADVAQLMHHCSSDVFVRGGCDYDFLAPPANPDRHTALARDLVKRCRAFTGFDDQDLPRPAPQLP
ncbi:polysaccharide pyruvyl transferase family protein [Blastomonas sp. SL216]|uniref:polysaccharide pyruvyl transferase family protein n=1 Tax=Blastomonas sp. SL216 TaxID=2995169 RepID=UPI002377474B|nr:polysaccharide pyruvyl transferase family protein [Blastomonas sp. SL216]